MLELQPVVGLIHCT